jgi:hypothetical protein
MLGYLSREERERTQIARPGTAAMLAQQRAVAEAEALALASEPEPLSKADMYLLQQRMLRIVDFLKRQQVSRQI